MEHVRARAVLACLLASGLLPGVPAAAQTLLWTARYDSGGADRLASGKPFRVEGSGAVTVAGLAGAELLLARYLPDGTFDAARRQQLTPAFEGTAVLVDRDGRAVWAGYRSGGTMVGDQATLLARVAFTGSPEVLHSEVVGPVQGWTGTAIVESADGGLLFGYHLSGHAALSVDYVTKLEGTHGRWTAAGGGNICAWRTITPDTSGGALVTFPASASNGTVQRIDSSGALLWSHHCLDAGWPWDGNPMMGLVDATGNAFLVGMTPSADMLTARLDASGAFAWQRSFDGAGHGEDRPVALVGDVAGSLYLAASSIGTGGHFDFATLKYDAAGTLLWSRTYDGGSDDTPAGAAVDSAGNAWVTGRSGGDVFTIRYDPSGVPTFSHRFTPPAQATVAGVAVDGWGNATVAFSAANDIFLLRYGEAPATSGPIRFHALSPCRAFDSRDPSLGGPNPLAGPSEQVVRLAGVCGVSSSAKAISLNVTVVGATQPGNLVLFPAGRSVPITSATNYSAGQTRANNATVGVGSEARLGLRVSQGGGSVHVLLDVVGYWE